MFRALNRTMLVLGLVFLLPLVVQAGDSSPAADAINTFFERDSLNSGFYFPSIESVPIQTIQNSIHPALNGSSIELTPTPVAEEGTVTSQRAITVVNQVGYFVGQQKVAILARDVALDAAPTWELRDAVSGAVVSSGTAEGGALDATSNDYLYRADFSAFDTAGSYIISIDGVDSQPFQIGSDLYAGLSRDALRYFYLNRSGIELTQEFAGEWARAAGHVSDNDVTCYSGQAADGSTWDGCDYRLNAQGGWYDAGDYGKYVVNGGISVWTLLNFYERAPGAFADGSLNIPESGNGVSDMLDEVRWEMEFLLAMQVPQGQPLEGMAHHKLHDLRWSGVPSLPPSEVNNDDARNGRFLMPPSTAATLNLAAAAAQCARIWRDIDAAFAERCLTVAERAWDAANAHPDMFYGRIPGQGGGDYSDGSVHDEFFWAAAELYITTGTDVYRDYLTSSAYFTNLSYGPPIWWGGTAGYARYRWRRWRMGCPKRTSARSAGRSSRRRTQRWRSAVREGYRTPITANEYVWGSNSGVLNKAICWRWPMISPASERYSRTA
ncbi:MAG: glycoside hydrolase family 9 protein [Anaerolineae bacterium]